MTKQLTTLERSTMSSITAAQPAQHTDQCQQRDLKPVPWYAGILCRLGAHWGKWAYLAEGNCSQILICGRCTKTRLRTKHQRQWQYIREGDCEQVRTCQRCQAESGNRTRHTWGQATYAGDTGYHTCQRCGKEESWNVSTG